VPPEISFVAIKFILHDFYTSKETSGAGISNKNKTILQTIFQNIEACRGRQ
jgi:hypothetical protein